MTGRDLVSASLRLIGALAQGESLEASEATDGLAALNRMIDSWSTEGLIIHVITQENPLTLTAGDSTITMGASGDITTRPQSIESAIIRSGSTDYPPMRKLSVDEYARISNKGVQGIPDSFYDDGGHPQRTITFYPVPAGTFQFVPFTKRPLTTITSLDTTISLPPGYERALVYNGAVEIGPEYGRPLDPRIEAIAIESKAAIKRANHRPSYLRCDDIPAGSRGAFDINTGDNRG